MQDLYYDSLDKASVNCKTILRNGKSPNRWRLVTENVREFFVRKRSKCIESEAYPIALISNDNNW